MEKPDLLRLIPELEEWGCEDDPRPWVAQAGSVELAIGYSFVFWPAFKRVGPYVVREEIEEESVREWEAGGHTPTQIEWVLNHIHIYDLHQPGQAPDATEEQLRHLGRVLTEIHRVKLKHDFPELDFLVEFNDEPGLDLAEYQFSFWQKPEAPAGTSVEGGGT